MTINNVQEAINILVMVSTALSRYSRTTVGERISFDGAYPESYERDTLVSDFSNFDLEFVNKALTRVQKFTDENNIRLFYKIPVIVEDEEYESRERLWRFNSNLSLAIQDLYVNFIE